ncbi:OsmC family protein [Halorientalis pallida]|uniref:OsmC family protein n=1 Tax=Halorientalis pallida TaxID=2479928 RepID=UPI003C6F39EC
MASEPETQHRMGVDLDTYHEFVAWVADEPDEAKMAFSARGESEDTAARTTASVGEWTLGGDQMGEERHHELHYGVPPEIETEMGFADPADRIEAVETALSALTACINATVTYNALEAGIDMDDVTTSASLSVDPRYLLGQTDEAEGMLGDPEIEVDIESDGLDDADRERLASFYERSPVYRMLTDSHPNEPSVTVHED